jgi:N-sulfoglucosamine sulfohydrolase
MRSLLWFQVPLLLLLMPFGLRAAEKRNVLLLIADDLGLQVGCYGDAQARTPHLDALAKSGVRFSHGFAAVSSCSSSRATVYTGQHIHTNGQYGLAHAAHNFSTRVGVKSLPGLLNAAGYRTGIIGKIHVQPRSVYPFGVEITKDLAGARDVGAVARAATSFFKDVGDSPFALVVGYTDPHRAARGFANDRSYDGIKTAEFRPADLPLPYFLSDHPETRADLADYYQSVHRLDQGIGLMLAALAKAGHADDTLVLFISDNGMPFPGAKTTLYDAGLHLPLIVRSPLQKKAGVVNQALVSWVDLLPTILDWTGVKAPANLAGRSFLPILTEENPRGWDEVFASHVCHEVTMYYPMRSIRTRTHHYIRNLAHKLDYPTAQDLFESPTWQGVLKRGDRMLGKRSTEQFTHRPAEELYDLQKDPDELHNLAGGEEAGTVLADLRKRLKDWQERTGDPWLVK